MSNVKPMVGQAWDNSGVKMKLCEIKNNIATFRSDFLEVIVEIDDRLYRNFTFFPQNDLEWLAVNVDAFPDYSKYISKGLNVSRYLKSGLEHLVIDGIFEGDQHYTRQQWQNMRYELGLDEPKNKITWADCPFPTININCPCTMAPLKKEAKMINLRKSAVGDKFDSNNERYELLMKSDKDFVIKGNGGRLYIVNRQGSSYDADAVKLTTKHEPRHWLKDLPNTDFFSDGVNWLAYYKGIGAWFAYYSEPSSDNSGSEDGGSISALDMIKMPKITGDEWKLSKISIPDLNAWQAANSKINR